MPIDLALRGRLSFIVVASSTLIYSGYLAVRGRTARRGRLAALAGRVGGGGRGVAAPWDDETGWGVAERMGRPTG